MSARLTTAAEQADALRHASSRIGNLFRAAEEMSLSRADIEAMQRRFPGRYDCLTYYRTDDESGAGR